MLITYLNLSVTQFMNFVHLVNPLLAKLPRALNLHYTLKIMINTNKTPHGYSLETMFNMFNIERLGKLKAQLDLHSQLLKG